MSNAQNLFKIVSILDPQGDANVKHSIVIDKHLINLFEHLCKKIRLKLIAKTVFKVTTIQRDRASYTHKKTARLTEPSGF